MRKGVSILFLVLCMMPSCRKNDVIPTSGTAIINNKLIFDNNRQTYIGYGFLFPKAELVSILSNPGPDITIDSDGTNLSFQADNLKDSFFKVGDYPDAAKASEEFGKLTAPSVLQWTGMAYPVKPNQIWIYRSGDEHFAKIRVISIISEVRENRDYAECTFEWQYQPDGTLTFPAR
jgi:hypothetical protein